MSRSGLLAATITALVVVLIGVGLRDDDASWSEPPPETPAPVAPSEAPADVAPSEAPPVPAPGVPDPLEPEASLPRVLLGGQPTRLDYPLQEKFQGQVWSDVPYELIAAHDGKPEEAGEGSRRLFIALVAPDLSDALLERLVGDLRERHRDARFLRIRIFDSREAAMRPSFRDDGAARDTHLLADLFREPGRERLLLRGVEVRP